MIEKHLREGSNRFLQNRQDPPHNDGNAHQPGDAPQGGKRGHDRAGQPGAGRLR